MEMGLRVEEAVAAAADGQGTGTPHSTSVSKVTGPAPIDVDGEMDVDVVAGAAEETIPGNPRVPASMVISLPCDPVPTHVAGANPDDPADCRSSPAIVERIAVRQTTALPVFAARRESAPSTVLCLVMAPAPDVSG